MAQSSVLVNNDLCQSFALAVSINLLISVLDMRGVYSDSVGTYWLPTSRFRQAKRISPSYRVRCIGKKFQPLGTSQCYVVLSITRAPLRERMKADLFAVGGVL
jgi:hypothetical protein